MNRALLKFGLVCYRLIGSVVILIALLSSLLYFILPFFISADEVKSEVLKSLSVPVQFKSIDWGFSGFSPTLVIHDVTLYENRVEKVTVEFDWIEWLKNNNINIKKILFKKAMLKAQYREDKIYLEKLAEYPILFNQESSSNSVSIKQVELIDSYLIIGNQLNQVFETEHTDIIILNKDKSFILDVKGRLKKKNAPFQFGLKIVESGKQDKSQLYISGEKIDLSDLQFFFKDILISGKAHVFQLWLEGEWGNFNRLISKGNIADFGYFFEKRQLFYPHLSGQFGIEWKPKHTEFIGLNIRTEPEPEPEANLIAPPSQFYVAIPEALTAEVRLSAKDFPLNRLDNIVHVFLAEKPGLSDWWQQTLPRGYLVHLDANVPNILNANAQNVLPELIKGISGDILVQDLTVNQNSFHMSMKNVSHFSAHSFGGLAKISLKAEAPSFQDKYYFPDGLALENVSGTIWYWNQPDVKKVYLQELTASLGKANFKYNGFWEKNLWNTDWYTESAFSETNLDVAQLLSLMPKKIVDKGLAEWFQSALISGKLKQAKGIIRGRLNDFPYDQDQAQAPKGVLEIEMAVEDATIKYQPDWPELKNADGDIKLDSSKLTLHASEAKILDSNIESATGFIPNVNAPNPELKIQAKIQSSFPKAKDFIQHSALNVTLGEKIAPLNMIGPLNLLLDMKIPLNLKSLDKTEYRGLLNFDKTSVSIPKLDLTISALKGVIFFSPRGMSSSNLSGNLFGTPTQFTLASDIQAADPRLKISAKGEVEIAKLNQWFSIVNSDLISGKTNYTANLFLKHTSSTPEGELKFYSDLAGVALNLPEPFQKKPEETENFHMALQFYPQSIINAQLKYGEKIHLDYALKATQKVWASQSARVVLGKKQSESSLDLEADVLEKSSFFLDNPFSIEGHLNTLDLSEWQTLFSAANTNTSAFSSNFAVKLKVDNLNAFGEVFKDMTIQVGLSGLSSREITLIGERLKGKVVLPIGPCTGAIQADFEYLNFPKNVIKEKKTEQNPLNKIKIKAGNCPIELTVAKLVLDEKIIENLKMHFIPEEKGFNLSNIQAKAPYTSLQASGFWTLTPKSHIALKGTIQTKNIQDTLQAGGIESTLHAATGQIRFDLNWEKDLTDIDLTTVNGDMSVSLKNGYVKGAEPGIGRILSLLSIDNIQRRLQLDFSDVAKEGLAMDKLTASFHFKNGKMKTEDLILDSPAARIELMAEAMLNTKIVEGTIKVMPKITSSLPIAAAIAVGNPAVGAAVWIADKILGKRLQEITQYQYQLSGSIDKPKLTSVNNIKNKIK